MRIVFCLEKYLNGWATDQQARMSHCVVLWHDVIGFPKYERGVNVSLVVSWHDVIGLPK